METNTLFIFYNAGQAKEPDRAVLNAIGDLGPAAQIMPAVWHVKSERTGVQAFDRLTKVIAPTDQLLVIDSARETYNGWPEPTGAGGAPTS